VRAWVPPKVSKELREETERREGAALQALQLDHIWAYKKEFDADLNRIVEGMKLVWCPDPAPVEAVTMGARAGRWGLLCPPIKGGPWSIKPLLGDDGDSYVEPGSWVFDMLRAQDWWNPEVRRDRERAMEELERTKKRREQQEHEDRTQEMLERWMAATRTQVSMNSNSKWSQNVRGKRGTLK